MFEPNVLWSGTIGSLVAAIIGGLVALVVVRLTARQQSSLARHERDVASLADFIALSEAQFWETARTAANGNAEPFPSDLFIRHRAAVAQMRMSDGWAKELGETLSFMPHLMQNLVATLISAHLTDRHDIAAKASDALNTLASMAAASLPAYPAGDKKARANVLTLASMHINEGKEIMAELGQELR